MHSRISVSCFFSPDRLFPQNNEIKQTPWQHPRFNLKRSLKDIDNPGICQANDGSVRRLTLLCKVYQTGLSRTFNLAFSALLSSYFTLLTPHVLIFLHYESSFFFVNSCSGESDVMYKKLWSESDCIDIEVVGLSLLIIYTEYVLIII